MPTTSLASSAALNKASLRCLARSSLALLSSLYMSSKDSASCLAADNLDLLLFLYTSAIVLLPVLVIAICSSIILIVSALASSRTVSKLFPASICFCNGSIIALYLSVIALLSSPIRISLATALPPDLLPSPIVSFNFCLRTFRSACICSRTEANSFSAALLLSFCTCLLVVEPPPLTELILVLIDFEIPDKSILGDSVLGIAPAADPITLAV